MKGRSALMRAGGVALLHKNIQKFGTITNTHAAACAVQGEIIAVPPQTRTP